MVGQLFTQTAEGGSQIRIFKLGIFTPTCQTGQIVSIRFVLDTTIKSAKFPLVVNWVRQSKRVSLLKMRVLNNSTHYKTNDGHSKPSCKKQYQEETIGASTIKILIQCTIKIKKTRYPLFFSDKSLQPSCTILALSG